LCFFFVFGGVCQFELLSAEVHAYWELAFERMQFVPGPTWEPQPKGALKGTVCNDKGRASKPRVTKKKSFGG